MIKLFLYLKRVITRTGPHGKYCGCNKWGHYIGLGCPHPTRILIIDTKNYGIGL